MPDKLRIYGYCRESTTRQFENGYNISDQERKIRQYVQLYYSDVDYDLTILSDAASAKTLRRPKIRELITLIKSKKVDVLIIHNLDRLTRRLSDLDYLVELIQRYKVNFISINERIDLSSMTGILFLKILVIIGSLEIDTLSDRTKRGVLESAKQGNYSRARVPYGYKRGAGNKGLLVIDEEAEVVRTIYDDFIDKRMNIERIVNCLNSETESKKWTKERIARILTNPEYCGEFRMQGEVFTDIVPAIITKDRFKAAKALLKNGRTTEKNFYLFKGIVYCSECNGLMKCVCMSHKKGKTYLYYQCKQCNVRLNESKILDTIKGDILHNKIELNDLLNETDKIKKRKELLSKVRKINYHHDTGLIEISYF